MLYVFSILMRLSLLVNSFIYDTQYFTNLLAIHVKIYIVLLVNPFYSLLSLFIVLISLWSIAKAKWFSSKLTSDITTFPWLGPTSGQEEEWFCWSFILLKIYQTWKFTTYWLLILFRLWHSNIPALQEYVCINITVKILQVQLMFSIVWWNWNINNQKVVLFF